MEKKEVDKILKLRENLIKRFSLLRDYKNNKNAMMKEFDHAQLLHEIIVEIDGLLKEYVNFSE